MALQSTIKWIICACFLMLLSTKGFLEYTAIIPHHTFHHRSQLSLSSSFLGAEMSKSEQKYPPPPGCEAGPAFLTSLPHARGTHVSPAAKILLCFLLQLNSQGPPSERLFSEVCESIFL